jgi:small subunit ribosomal protein S8
MGISDPIADCLTIIRNAALVRKEKADVPGSRKIEAILKILKQEGYIQDYRSMQAGNVKKFRVYLKYTEGKSAITNLKRISRPGFRKYVSSREVPRVLGGLGMAIISTSKGVLSDKETRSRKLGGEVICYVY